MALGQPLAYNILIHTTSSIRALEADTDVCIAVCSLVNEIVWVKMTVNRRLAKSHGCCLQHAKQA